jgi:hypothetical protein
MLAEILLGLWFFNANSRGIQGSDFAYASPPFRTQVECEAARRDFGSPSSPCEQSFVWVTYDGNRQPKGGQ